MHDSNLVDIPTLGQKARAPPTKETLIPHATISHIERNISDEDNSSLLAPFVIDEFRTTLSQLHNDKSAGPDGLNPAFYKKIWDVLGDEIFSTTTMWLNQGIVPPNLNNIDVVLIPKKDNPSAMLNLRPISLCNVLYKIVSKVLAGSSLYYQNTYLRSNMLLLKEDPY